MKPSMLSVMLLLLSLPSSGDRRAGDPPRAMWLWATNAVKRTQADDAARIALFDFCDAPHGDRDARITILYLEFGGDASLWGSFLADAHRRGIKVERLIADGEFQAESAAWLKQSCDQTLQHNRDAKQQERFDGIHFDIEPSVRAKWSQQGYHELMAYARKLVDEYDGAHSPRMTIAADINPGWPQHDDNSRPSYDDAMQYCDYIVSMAYRDSAAAQLERAFIAAQSEEAKRRGVGFWVGCEAADLGGSEPEYVTYFEEGWLHLHTQIEQLPALFRTRNVPLSGIAIHHYDSYRDMTRDPT